MRYFVLYNISDVIQIPKLKNYKPVITSLLCVSCYVISLPCVSNSGEFLIIPISSSTLSS